MDSWDRWTPARAWRWQHQQTRLTYTCSDWMRHLASYAIPPSVFTDPVTGDGLSLATAFTTRGCRAAARLAGGRDLVREGHRNARQ